VLFFETAPLLAKRLEKEIAILEDQTTSGSAIASPPAMYMEPPAEARFLAFSFCSKSSWYWLLALWKEEV
jgi:hypothetical protein